MQLAAGNFYVLNAKLTHENKSVWSVDCNNKLHAVCLNVALNVRQAFRVKLAFGIELLLRLEGRTKPFRIKALVLKHVALCCSGIVNHVVKNHLVAMPVYCRLSYQF